MKRWVWMGLLAGVASGQMHKVERPEQVVRAVGVYEWTGDLAKPKGMRLVPVTIFIDGQVEDAAVYLARPIPMALQGGTLYELDDAGVEKGLVDLMSARHVQVPDGADLPPFDDGWFGYGKFEAPAATKVSSRTAKPSSRASMNGKALDDSKPHFGKRNTDDDDKPEAGSPEDVKIDSGTGDKDDVDRPTLRRRPAVDPKTAKKNKKAQGESGVIAEKGSLNDDPDRPTIKRKTGLTEEDFPALNGLPADMKQMVAVSDPKRREPHPFARAWEDDAEKQMVLGKMREIAQAELVKYGPVPVQAVSTATPYTGPQLSANAAAAAAAAAKAPVAEGPGLASQDTTNGAPVLRRNKVAADAAAQEQVKAPVVAAAPSAAAASAAAAKAAVPSAAALAKMTPVQRRAALAKAKKAAADAAKVVPEVLVEEEVKGFTLSYGGAPTYVYTAHTAGTGAALRYVTIVAQGSAIPGAQLELKVAMKSVTDAAHLDRTAWMRFVDVVDVEASNRASLLFELRGQSSRQFGVYRVIDGKADTVFMGGTTQ
ncbi:hypothetical protein SAMN05421771_0797 [Granulicella pectinivorans]|uniref:Uncharacterized protein n=1 Tax=Granulicella pectinivorans TaxID=474950 RepID=A0A1I6LJK6_9BACT|nr:hypothetical protein [Granulicella pectinivorans]SFS03649.1 hypothetical protein SAMN05421771_0797 [Granulicella pectinivorans]